MCFNMVNKVVNYTVFKQMCYLSSELPAGRTLQEMLFKSGIVENWAKSAAASQGVSLLNFNNIGYPDKEEKR